MKRLPRPGDLAELVRLPAVLSVPGDVLAGAAASGVRSLPVARTAALVGASCSLYLAGMALNDWADRDVDARERPQRPIPSGRVSANEAAVVAHALTVVGLGLARAAGRRSLAAALPVAASVYLYDLGLKHTRAAPVAMAACRAFDVRLGASLGDVRAARPAIGTVAAHTLLLTVISGREVSGSTRGAVGGVALGSAAVAAGALSAVDRRDAATLAAVGSYAASQLREGARAAADPRPATLQRYVGRSVLATVPLQATFVAASGRRRLAAALFAAWPAARRASRRRAVS